MVVNLRVLYFSSKNDLFVKLDLVSKLFDIEFEENEFPEQGIHINNILPALESCGWNIKIDQPKDKESNIKVILTQEIIEEINI